MKVRNLAFLVAALSSANAACDDVRHVTRETQAAIAAEAKRQLADLRSGDSDRLQAAIDRWQSAPWAAQDKDALGYCAEAVRDSYQLQISKGMSRKMAVFDGNLKRHIEDDTADCERDLRNPRAAFRRAFQGYETIVE